MDSEPVGQKAGYKVNNITGAHQQPSDNSQRKHATTVWLTFL